MEETRKGIELAARGLEILAIVVIVTFILVGTVQGLVNFARKRPDAYTRYRVVLGRTLLIGLNLLVAADIVSTVSTPLTPTNLLLLGGLVMVRTFLGWTIVIEIEGRWPWQPATASRPGRAEGSVSQEKAPLADR
jgi:uncharacterized membrane protein